MSTATLMVLGSPIDGAPPRAEVAGGALARGNYYGHPDGLSARA
jgi:hypothetical protein